jgi:tellurite resistance protein
MKESLITSGVDASLAATDPRWVLAMRVNESMQGAVLPPERRQSLLRLGRVLGLTAFDSNLIIAIVQDRARRGETVVDGIDQLRLVSTRKHRHAARQRVNIAVAAITLVAAEAVILWWLIF